MIAILIALLLAAPPAEAQRRARTMPLKRRIDLLLATKDAAGARWGLHVVDLAAKRVIYQRDADEHFTPASNTKLFTTALAIERLGPSYRFETTVRAAAPPDANGVLAGDLRLTGGGDPSLSGRAYPYRKDSEAGDPLEPVEQLADQVARAGVKRISGDIVGDDRLYVYQPYPEGWTVDDAIWEYGAPVTALPFNDGSFTLWVKPGEQAGDAAIVETNPPLTPLVVDNRVVTTGENGKLAIDRIPGSRLLRLTGTVSRPVRDELSAGDPALYASTVLHDALTRRGIAIDGHPVAVHRYTPDEPFDPKAGVELARRQSPPLMELAGMVNKVSQNLHAEILLRETARVRAQDPTREAGLKELAEFLKEIGIAEDACHFEDGSGLSRRTLVSPRAVTRLLEYMDGTVHRAEWESLLPVGGEDGTLQRRFEKQAAARAIHAKTGTLATASALAGYVTTARGRRLAFSIIANNHTGPSSAVRRVIDRIGLALVAWEGK
jgi:D-alanyl-D-alanine carboxypeptidase/D-alanyl-D-alanine-endopeptidase (penicillin-binding protein 4)